MYGYSDITTIKTIAKEGEVPKFQTMEGRTIYSLFAQQPKLDIREFFKFPVLVISIPGLKGFKPTNVRNSDVVLRGEGEYNVFAFVAKQDKELLPEIEEADYSKFLLMENLKIGFYVKKVTEKLK